MLLMMMKVTFDNTTITWGQYVTNNGMTACHFQILRLFDVLPNFLFTTSETIREYYLQTWYIRVAERLKIEYLTQSNPLVTIPHHTTPPPQPYPP